MPVERPVSSTPPMLQHPDGNREIRAICMATLPCPPIPVMASREDADEVGARPPPPRPGHPLGTVLCLTTGRARPQGNRTCGDATANSHDLVAHLMNVRAAAGQDDVNTARGVMQVSHRAHPAARAPPWVRA